jgi:hypothetical protein
MNRHVLAVLAATIALVGIGVGCTAILDIPSPVTAYRWCLDAEPARGLRGDNLLLQNIKAPSGLWMRGCKCYCAADNEIMIQGADGQLTPGSQDEVFYANEVAQLQAAGALACSNQVIAMQAELGTTLDFTHPQAVTCADAVVDEAPYFATECVLDEEICPPGAGGGGGGGGGATGGGDATDSGETTGTGDISTTGGATADESSGGGSGGSMVYGIEDWADVIDCPSSARCEVDAAFVDELLADLGMFSDDAIAMSTGVSALGHRGFVFAELGPDSLPAALGFAPGDVLWRVNGLELRSFADVGHAFERLDQATVFTVQVDRQSQTLQRTFRLVHGLGDR